MKRNVYQVSMHLNCLFYARFVPEYTLVRKLVAPLIQTLNLNISI